MVDGEHGPAIDSVEEMAGRFTSELIKLTPIWAQRLADDPAALEQLERDVHADFSRGADLVIAGLMAVVMKQVPFAAASEQTRVDFEQPLVLV